MIRVAIVGLGNISAAHIEAWKAFPERARIVAMVDIVPDKARARAAEYHIDCEIFDDHHAILDREDIDLVDVCTPPYVHAEISINALRAGKHVICEKPMAASLEECDAVIRAARESGRLFSSIAQNRFRTSITRLKQVLDAGICGEIRHFTVDSLWWRGHCYYDLWWRGTWEKEGGGCTLNHAVHHIDMLGWMMGLPDSVTSVLTNAAHDNAEIEDLSVSVLRYGKALATVTASVVHHGEEQQLIVQCADARVSAPWKVCASGSLPNGFPYEDPEKERQIDEFYNALPEVRYEGHTGQIDDVLTTLESGSLVPSITGEDGRRTIELITAIYKAGSTGQTVRLPLQKDDPFYTVEGIRAHAPHFYEKAASLQNLGDGGAISLGSKY